MFVGIVRIGLSFLPMQDGMAIILNGRSILRQPWKKWGNGMCLTGNISNVHALYQGTPEDVRRQARYAIESGV